jgi:hypothetical protein
MGTTSPRPILRQLPRHEGYPFAEIARRGPVLQQVADLSRAAFGETAFSLGKYRSLLRANRRILLVVRDPDGLVQGYADVIPIRREFGDALVEGRKKEAEIEPDDVIPERELHAAVGGYIYLAAFVTRRALQQPSTKALAMDRTFQKLVWATLDRVLEITTRNSSLKKALALAYETQDKREAPGLVFLRRFQFVEQGRSKEGFPVFVFDLGHQTGTFASHFNHISQLRHHHIHRRKQQAKFLAGFGSFFGCLVLLSFYLFLTHKNSWQESAAVFLASAVAVFLVERLLGRLWKRYEFRED